RPMFRLRDGRALVAVPPHEVPRGRQALARIVSEPDRGAVQRHGLAGGRQRATGCREHETRTAEGSHRAGRHGPEGSRHTDRGFGQTARNGHPVRLEIENSRTRELENSRTTGRVRCIIGGMKLCCKTITLLVFACALAVSIAAQQPASQGTTPPVDEGQQQLREGRHAEALAFYKKILAETPDSYQANNQAGVALDLLGRYEEARKHFEKAIAAAPDAEAKSRATRNMATSYAFSRDCASAAKYQ